MVSSTSMAESFNDNDNNKCPHIADRIDSIFFLIDYSYHTKCMFNWLENIVQIYKYIYTQIKNIILP